MQSIDQLFVTIESGRFDTLSDESGDLSRSSNSFNSSSKSSSNKQEASNNVAVYANELSDVDRREIVAIHNETRARYGLPPVTWSDSLAQLAARWADKRYFGHWDDRDGKTRNALGADYVEKPRLAGGRKAGESLAVWTNRPPPGTLPGVYGTRLWLEEEPFFDCATGVCNERGVCGHYKQIVHEPVREVGCALRTFADGVDPRSWPSNVAGHRDVQLLVCQYDRIQTPARPFAPSRCTMPRK